MTGTPPAMGNPPPPGWLYSINSAPMSPPPRREGKLLAIGVAGMIVLATAALVVGLLALTRPATSSGTSSTSTPATKNVSAPSADDTTDVDKALCNKIAPLMKRSQLERNGFVDAGPTGSPGANAAQQKFVDDTKQWANDAQQALDADSGPPRHLTRTIQRYVDDMLLYVEGLRSGRENKYDHAAWIDASESANGPLTVCYALGVTW